MNKTQKAAWVSLALTVLLVAFSIRWIIMASTATTITKSALLLWFLLFCGIAALAIVLFRRKQSPVEVDLDERDRLIKTRAVQISYISLWVFLVAASIVPNLILGDSGAIPVSVLPPVLFLIFLIVMLVWSVAILVQYGWGIKGEKS
ncbi:MAG: hypothetical protein ACYTEL_14380 [Planctomycetota bacterium]|jgi:hypothetical protein